MKFVACGASVVGPRHLDLGEANQDAMGLAGWRGGWLASVADGLGSRSRSDVGARCACQVARRVLRTAPAHLDFPDALLSIHADWLKAVAPLSPKDVATTILFARVSGEGNVHAAQLGDGLLLLRYAGKFHCITPERTGYGNQTQALETTLAPDQWHVFSGNFTLPGDGVVLLSDGVADDLEPEQLAEFVDVLYQALSTKNRRRGRRWIHSELVNWATPMHGDDKTLAAIFRT